MLRPRVKKAILPARAILPAGQKLRLSTNPPRGPMATTPNRLRWQPPAPCAVNTTHRKPRHMAKPTIRTCAVYDMENEQPGSICRPCTS